MSDGSGGGGGRFAGIIGTVIILGILNVLSQVFDWGWVFY